jgi:two-component system, OmpR family, sensor histidine kinase CiaH
MVEDLLLLSRIDSGTLQFTCEPVEAQPILKEIGEKAKKLLDGKNIEIRVQSEPISVNADGPRLRQVLWILIDNASQYTGKKGVIELDAKAEGKSGRIMVSDNGSGIPDEHIGRVFDRFYQAQDLPGKHGAGLGLSLARSLVEGMGGRIELVSKVGEGTRVSIILERS